MQAYADITISNTTFSTSLATLLRQTMSRNSVAEYNSMISRNTFNYPRHALQIPLTIKNTQPTKLTRIIHLSEWYAATGNACIHLWDLKERQFVHKLHEQAFYIAPIGEDRIAISDRNNIYIKYWLSNILCNTIHIPARLIPEHKAIVSFGNFIAAILANHEFIVYNINTPGGSVHFKQDMKFKINTIEPTPVGIAICTQKREISIYNVEQNSITKLLDFKREFAGMCMFSPNILVYVDLKEEFDEYDVSYLHYYDIIEKKRVKTVSLTGNIHQMVNMGKECIHIVGRIIHAQEERRCADLHGLVFAHEGHVTVFDHGIATAISTQIEVQKWK